MVRYLHSTVPENQWQHTKRKQLKSGADTFFCGNISKRAVKAKSPHDNFFLALPALYGVAFTEWTLLLVFLSIPYVLKNWKLNNKKEYTWLISQNIHCESFHHWKRNEKAWRVKIKIKFLNNVHCYTYFKKRLSHHDINMLLCSSDIKKYVCNIIQAPQLL